MAIDNGKLLKTKIWYLVCMLGVIDVFKDGPQKEGSLYVLGELGPAVKLPQTKDTELQSPKTLGAREMALVQADVYFYSRHNQRLDFNV